MSLLEDWDTIFREYWTFFVVGAIVTYFLVKRAAEALQDTKSLRQSARAAQAISDEERLEALRRARERQQTYVSEKTREDEVLRKERQARELEEKLQKSEEARKKFGGRSLGGDDAAAAPDADGPMKKLPKLPGGSREDHRPSYVPNNGHTSGYKPSGPASHRKRGG